MPPLIPFPQGGNIPKPPTPNTPEKKPGDVLEPIPSQHPEAKINRKREENEWLGAPLGDASPTPNGKGWCQHFQNGSIYCDSNFGGNVCAILGPIKAKWVSIGGEQSFLGFPITDELSTEGGHGKFNNFEGGSIYWSPDSGAHIITGPIRDKWLAFGREQSELGFPITDETATQAGDNRFVHFQGGAIYSSPVTGTNEVHGSIWEKYNSLGGPSSWLGFPISDETDFTENGRVNIFERGSIYYWSDTGAIELNDVAVQYTGLVCFGESRGVGSDEPYVILGTISPMTRSTIRSKIYEGVDSGSSRPDLIEIYRGKPYGLNLSVTLFENDEGDPDAYKNKVEEAVNKVADNAKVKADVIGVVAVIPVVGLAAALAVYIFWDDLKSLLTDGVNSALGTADDKIGEALIHISARQMIILASQTDNQIYRDIGFKLETPLLTDGDASYKVYFGLVPA